MTIHLPKILTDFFSNTHGGYKKDVVLRDNIFSTNLPIVELDLGIDVDAVLSDLTGFIQNNPIDRKDGYDLVPRIRGWAVTDVWVSEDTTLYPYIVDLMSKKYNEAFPIPAIPKNYIKYPNIIKELSSMNVTRCRFSTLQPWGYLYPHRDIRLNPRPIDYLWIPLNNPAGSRLGVYPVGEIHTKIGCGYLLNQENYIHAVWNNTDIERKVLVCELGEDQPLEFISLVTDSIKSQYKVVG